MPLDARPLAARYAALVAEGRLEPDDAQRRAVHELDGLGARLASHRLARKGSALGWLFARREPAAPIRGLYLWGAVGRGKTMLMDLFFESLPVQRKRRAHFHDFMADVHERIHAWRQQSASGGGGAGTEPIAPVAAALAAEAWVLCFDEFSVTDIADAMILGRLFEALFKHGVVVVATSNVPPARLYADGLNRTLFLPFVGLLAERLAVMELAARTDYRLEKLAGAPVYHVPADAAATAALDAAWEQLTKAMPVTPITLNIKSRSLQVPKAAGGVVRATFAEICERPLSAADYLALARAFHTVILDHVPVMGHELRNAAKRFIILVDILYEHHVKFLASAMAEPAELLRIEDGAEAFEFTRTASRLIEMRSEGYLALPHGRVDSAAAGLSTGLAET